MLSATFSVVTLYVHDVLKQRCKDIFFFVNVNNFLKKISSSCFLQSVSNAGIGRRSEEIRDSLSVRFCEQARAEASNDKPSAEPKLFELYRGDDHYVGAPNLVRLFYLGGFHCDSKRLQDSFLGGTVLLLL